MFNLENVFNDFFGPFHRGIANKALKIAQQQGEKTAIEYLMDLEKEILPSFDLAFAYYSLGKKPLALNFIEKRYNVFLKAKYNAKSFLNRRYLIDLAKFYHMIDDEKNFDLTLKKLKQTKRILTFLGCFFKEQNAIDVSEIDLDLIIFMYNENLEKYDQRSVEQLAEFLNDDPQQLHEHTNDKIILSLMKAEYRWNKKITRTRTRSYSSTSVVNLGLEACISKIFLCTRSFGNYPNVRSFFYALIMCGHEKIAEALFMDLFVSNPSQQIVIQALLEMIAGFIVTDRQDKIAPFMEKLEPYFDYYADSLQNDPSWPPNVPFYANYCSILTLIGRKDFCLTAREIFRRHGSEALFDECLANNFH